MYRKVFKNYWLVSDKFKLIEVLLLRILLKKFMDSYLDLKRTPFGSHSISDILIDQLPQKIRSLEIFSEEFYEVKGSCGNGNWTHTPWLAIYDKRITKTVQEGVYIVYLFSSDMNRVYLTLNQGCTKLQKSIGKRGTIRKMHNLAQQVREKIEQQYFKTDNNLIIGHDLYEQGSIFYITYTKDNIPLDQELIADLKKMATIYQKYYQIFHYNKQKAEHIDELTSYELKNKNSKDNSNVSQIIEHICKYIAAQGFTFEDELIKNFYLSLKTKPFVILAGISGTGKSKIAELVAEAVGATSANGRYKLIPVRPDWNDSADLLGYYNLQGEFVPGPLVKVIRDAIRNPDKPYFVCLDEMNLARVEYYFSEFLSIIESRKLVNGQIISHEINLNGNFGNVKDRLCFPENLYIIGTVNMDETTQSFSRKVLDRANTIELTEVNLSKFPEMSEAVDPIEIDNSFLKSDYLLIKDCFAGNEAFIQEKVQILEVINEIIARSGFQVGYRVRDEFCFYLLYNKLWGLLAEEQAIDFQILQKILPRIQGSDGQIKEILEELEKLFKDSYPASLKKVQFMLGRLESDGFTSFWP